MRSFVALSWGGWNVDRSLVVILPDGLAKGHAFTIIDIYKESELKIINSFYFRFTDNTASRFHISLSGMRSFDKLIQFVTSGDCVALWLEGVDVVSRLKTLNGDWWEPAEGTIRQRFPSAGGPAKIVYTSPSLEEARREYEIVLSLKPLQEVSRR